MSNLRMQRPAWHIFLSGLLAMLQSAFFLHSGNVRFCMLKVFKRTDIMMLDFPDKNLEGTFTWFRTTVG